MGWDGCLAAKWRLAVETALLGKTQLAPAEQRRGFEKTVADSFSSVPLSQADERSLGSVLVME